MSDTVESDISPDALEYSLIYGCRDSILIDIKNKQIKLFGEAHVEYGDAKLKAWQITIYSDSSLIEANGIYDSLGRYIGKPEFSDNGQSFTAYAMRYNFQTKKGKIVDVMTQDGESYVHGHEVKRMSNEVLYIKQGKYTTCSLDTPHFYIHASKLKVIPDELIVTGPAYMVIEQVPTPLAVPFGLFPNKKGKASGILIPTYGESPALGFYLLNGGYYWTVNDYMDLSITGDIYSKGSWGGKINSQYKKRYKYDGDFQFNYAEIKNSYREFPDFQLNREFFIRWNHRQDPKARPNSRFVSGVNIGTSNNFRNNFNSVSQDYLTNTFASNISYTLNIPRFFSPASLSLNARHNQNSQTRQVNVSLPDVAFTVARWSPFKNTGKFGKGQWYKNIGISYTGNFKNEITTYDTLISLDNLGNIYQNNLKNGALHTIPLSTSFKALKYLTITPAVNYTEKWYFREIRKEYDPMQAGVVVDTLTKFSRGGNLSYSVNATTKLYGTFNFKHKTIKAVRHVLTPTVGISYLPSNSIDQRNYFDPTTGQSINYSVYENSLFGTLFQAEAGLINYQILNNVEMKVLQKKDSTMKTEKLKIFENLSLSGNYNFLADSLRWSDVRISGRSYISKQLSLNMNATLTPYRTSYTGQKINSTYWDYNKTIGRITAFSLATSFSLRSRSQEKTAQKLANHIPDSLKDQLNLNPMQYIDFDIPWNIFVSYNFSYSKPGSYQKAAITHAVGLNGDFNVTRKWKVAFMTNYDIVKGAFAYTSFDIYRDMHCWEMAITWVPFGLRKSYMVRINAKSALLQDLKITRKREYYDLNSLYYN